MEDAFRSVANSVVREENSQRAICQVMCMSYLSPLPQRAFFPGVSGPIPPPLPKMEPLPVLDQVSKAQVFPVSCYKNSVAKVLHISG